MRAMVLSQFGEPDALELQDLPTPEPGDRQVLIDVHASGVNFPDLLVVGGTYQILPDLPFSPGKEVAGVVRAVGGGVAELKPGDRVMAQLEFGGYREQVLAAADDCNVLPDEISFEEAAAFGLGYLTCYFALVRRANMREGETVLVTGAGGGVASAGVQLAKALRGRVIAAGETPDKVEMALAQGADHALLSNPETLRDEVKALTGGAGADIVLETVGGALFAACMRCIAWEGRLVVIGFASGEIPQVKAGHVLVRNMSLVGLQVSDYRDREPYAIKSAHQHLFDLYRRGAIKVDVTASYPLEAAAQALMAVKAGEVRGKVVLTVADGAPS